MIDQNIDKSDLTLEQRVVLKLAKMGFLTSSGDVQRALKEFQYANYMISPINKDGSVHPEIDADKDGVPDENPPIKDIIENTSGVTDFVEECNHEPLSNDEIQEVFDNDIQK